MALRGRQWWKLVGLAGVVGVAATGAVAVRAERKRRGYTPDEVRSVLADPDSKPAVIAETQLAAFHIEEQRLLRLTPPQREYLEKYLR